jgi:PEP-CTERM motif
MKTLCALALAASLAAATLQAHAVVVDWGPHDAAEAKALVAPPGPLADTFLFSLTPGSTVTAVAVANNLSSVFNLGSGMVQLFRVETGPDALLGMFGFDGTSGSTAHTFASLAAGDYFYLVSGMANGSAGAVYALTSTVAPVPEPAQAGLFGAGLLACGLALRKRRRA